jgi:hypothetical protein
MIYKFTEQVQMKFIYTNGKKIQILFILNLCFGELYTHDQILIKLILLHYQVGILKLKCPYEISFSADLSLRVMGTYIIIKKYLLFIILIRE